MTDFAVEQLLAAYDDSFTHEWESVHSALEGVTDDIAAWQPSYYAHIERTADDPPPGSIIGNVAHLEHCLRHYEEILRTRSRTPAPPEPPADATFGQLRSLLEEAFAKFRTQIAALRDEDLALEIRPGLRIDQYVRSVTRHNAWHAGQMMMVKRMSERR